MGCTPKELLRRTTAWEIQELFAFMDLEPFGPQATNLNFGILSSLIRNTNVKKGTKMLTPADMALGEFILHNQVQSLEEQKAAVLRIAYAFGARIIKRKDTDNG